MENISKNIQKGLQTSIKGQNKSIIENIYKQTGNQALWVGNKNAKRASHLIQALNDPLFNYKDKSFDRAAISRLYYLLDNTELGIQIQAAVYAKLDLVLTSSMVRLVRFIVQGDVDWDLVQTKLLGLKESDDIEGFQSIQARGEICHREYMALIGRHISIIAYIQNLVKVGPSHARGVRGLSPYHSFPPYIGACTQSLTKPGYLPLNTGY